MSYLMRYAQSRSVVKGRTVRLEFARDFSGYWLTEDRSENQGESKENNFERISSRMGREVSLPSEIKIETPLSPVQYYKDGRIDPVTMYVCAESKNAAEQRRCFTVTTKIKRGSIDLAEGRQDDQ